MSNIATLDYNRQGQVFTACNQAGATVTLINTSTATGFILSNPFGSGKKLAILTASFAYSTVPTATAIVFLAQSIAPSPTAHATTTAIGVYAADGSGASTVSVARAYSASTTPNLPVYSKILGYSPTTPATNGLTNMRYYSEGDMLLVPGTYVQISYLGAAPVGVAEMSWVELPV